MPKTATTETTAEPAGLTKLRQKIAEMEKAAATAHAEEQKLAADAERLKEEARQRHAAREKLEREIKKAERQAIDEQRKIVPPRVTLEVARDVAETLLRAFEGIDQPSDGQNLPAKQRAAQLWEVIDACRVRLLTDEIDQDAHALTMSIESAIDAVDEWEGMRQPATIGASGVRAADLRMQNYPHESGIVERLLDELRAMLQGDEPKSIESIGQLLRQSVPLAQVCRMHHLILADGSADLESLGVLVDRALRGTPGFEREVHPWGHRKRMGALSADDAWAIREANLQSRREAAGNIPGSPQLAGTVRPGRSVATTENASADEDEEAREVRFRLFRQQQNAAASEAENATPGQPLSSDKVREGLHAAMSRRQ